MNCPTCTDTALVISERQGVEIDYCPKCRGVWLDRGELDKIIARADTYSEAPAARRSDDDDDDHRRYDNRNYDNRNYDREPRRKSFWSEIFD